MHGENRSNANPSGVLGVCPTGWHVPSEAEWTQLEVYMIGQSQFRCGNDILYCAKSLADTIGWPNSNVSCAVGNYPFANNLAGFGARPAGYSSNSYTSNGNHFGLCAYFWTTTEINQLYAWHSRIGYVGNDVLKNFTSKHSGFSVRCLRD